MRSGSAKRASPKGAASALPAAQCSRTPHNSPLRMMPLPDSAACPRRPRQPPRRRQGRLPPQARLQERRQRARLRATGIPRSSGRARAPSALQFNSLLRRLLVRLPLPPPRRPRSALPRGHRPTRRTQTPCFYGLGAVDQAGVGPGRPGMPLRRALPFYFRDLRTLRHRRDPRSHSPAGGIQRSAEGSTALAPQWRFPSRRQIADRPLRSERRVARSAPSRSPKCTSGPLPDPLGEPLIAPPSLNAPASGPSTAHDQARAAPGAISP